MKHTDRRNLGLELYFASHSSSFSGLKEFTSADVDEMLAHTPLIARYPIAHAMRSSLDSLRSMKDCPAELIPEEVIRLVGDGSAFRCCRDECISAFYGWLLDVARRNESERVERVSGLKTVASCFDRQTASFIRTCLALNNQRIVFSKNDGVITLSYAEHEWGRAFIDFIDCRWDEPLPEFMPGYLFSTEAERLEDGHFAFRLLVDTCFSSSDYSQRLMQDYGWHELSFTCSTASVRPVCCDYSGRIELLGTPRAEFIDRMSAILLKKENLLGDDALSPKESAMLPIARLITGSGSLLDRRTARLWQNEQLVLDSLDNRYAMQQFSRLLSDSKCSHLQELLIKSTEARFDDDELRTLACAKQYAIMYEQQLSDGSARPLLLSLSDRFSEMTADFEDSTLKTSAEKTIARHIADKIAPQLSAMKFEGSFPHYHRRRRRRTDYLSFMLLPTGEGTRRGIYSFNISLAAARVSSSRLKKLEENGVPFDRTNALDCQPELPSVCSYGELASADDGEYVRVEAKLYGTADRMEIKADLSSLTRYIKLANRQFRLGGIPLGYALSRLRKNQLPSPSPRLFLSSFSFSVVLSLLAAIAWVILSKHYPLPELTTWQTLGCACGLSIILNSILTVLRRIHIAGRLWRYR